MTVQKLIKLYEDEKQKYIDDFKNIEKQLKEGNLEEPEAYYLSTQLEETRVIVGFMNGFIQNLKLLESDEG